VAVVVDHAMRAAVAAVELSKPQITAWFREVCMQFLLVQEVQVLQGELIVVLVALVRIPILVELQVQPHLLQMVVEIQTVQAEVVVALTLAPVDRQQWVAH
jgi:hypothetical protein